jgi:hypothetical protein
MKISTRNRRQRSSLALVPASKRLEFIVMRTLLRDPLRTYAATQGPQEESQSPQSLDGLSMKRSGKKTVITLRYKPV